MPVAAAVVMASIVPAAAIAGGSPRTTVKVERLDVLGKPGVLANGYGRTVYMSTGDKHGRSSCYGSCTAVWKPLLAVGQVVAGPGANQKLLGTTRRRGGKRQVTYNGHPLYMYIAYPQKPGDYDGQGCDAAGTNPQPGEATWWVLGPQGRMRKSPIGICQGY
jgi:predicted lipoprotein with Yx(FWY)xxD motif